MSGARSVYDPPALYFLNGLPEDAQWALLMLAHALLEMPAEERAQVQQMWLPGTRPAAFAEWPALVKTLEATGRLAAAVQLWEESRV